MDDLTAEQRHRNMSNIKSVSRPEEEVRKYLFSKGFRFRKNDKRYPGKPDIVLPKYHTVIFVNGCFWHQHTGCKYAKIPDSNKEYWIPKLNHNVERDKENYQLLSKEGWNVIVVWECELKTKEKRKVRLRQISEQIQGKNPLLIK
jgi:DNA mismatch endonuclease (patch repair protein)